MFTPNVFTFLRFLKRFRKTSGNVKLRPHTVPRFKPQDNYTFFFRALLSNTCSFRVLSTFKTPSLAINIHTEFLFRHNLAPRIPRIPVVLGKYRIEQSATHLSNNTCHNFVNRRLEHRVFPSKGPKKTSAAIINRCCAGCNARNISVERQGCTGSGA